MSESAAVKGVLEMLRASYEALVAYAKGLPEWNEDAAGAFAGSVAHAAYHLGAIRQVAKLAR